MNMAIRFIVKDPDPVLREIAKPVPKITPNIIKLLNDMAETMYDAPGIGLAAPQVGISKRVIVMDVGDEHGLIELVNPVIVEKTGEQIGPEGCLSIVGLSGDVRRWESITVTGLNRDGKEVTIIGTGLLARCMQHEIDHLNGVLFTDIADKVYRNEEQEDEA